LSLDDPLALERVQDSVNGFQVVPLAWGTTFGYGGAVAVHHCGQFRVQTALGATDRLRVLATGRVGPVLVQLDVRAVQMTQLTTGIAGEHLLPKSALIPPALWRVHCQAPCVETAAS